MEVRIVEVPKVEEKREVPFVVGGVYRYVESGNKVTNEARFLIRVGDTFYMIGPNGVAFNSWDGEAEARGRNFDAMYEYVPNAYIAIPKEVE